MAAEMDANLTTTLLEEADPVIRAAIRRKLHVTLRSNDSREQNMDGLDLLGEVQVKLLTKLRGQGGEGGVGEGGIKEFKAYAATVAYHCCADYLRAKYPQRTSLKNCLRRLMDKMDGYAVWTSADGELMCGFAGWKSGRAAAAGEKIRELQQNPAALPEEAMPPVAAEGLSGKEWLRLLEAVFDFAEGPVAMDDLLAIVAPMTGVEDVPEYDDAGGDEEDGGGSAVEKVAARGADPYSERLTVEKLKLFWGAVLQLLPWHRAALLLNMRDGDLDALPYYGVVSIEGIGEAIELKEKQLTRLEQEVGVGPGSGSSKKAGQRFAACWKYLPLEDTVIGLVLEVTRAQVIGYRNKARERLARTLKGVM
jgi:DNA-directed RNA polymerase specialized sigma24 family protein